ncbi:MAG: MFS transporter [Chloroflexia bacterium]|nr:MFS transporter [Chloroflexia bacterium]
MATAGADRRNRLPLFALLAANAVSTFGNALTIVALPWFVLATTGSATKTGLTGFFLLLPGLLAGVFGGVVVDRLGFKRASIFADAVSGIGVALIPLLYHTVGLAFWQLLALVFLGALLDVPGLTARRSLLPELATLADVRLERVNAAYEANNQLAFLLGPPIAGLLIATMGPTNVLWLDAATFAVSVVAIAVAVPGLAGAVAPAAGRYLAEVMKGLRFLRQDRVLLALAAGIGVSNFFGSPLFAVILPVYGQEILGSATTLGLLFGVTGAGSLVGTLAYGAVGYRLPRRLVWLVGFLVMPLQIWVLLLEPSVAVLATAMAISGVMLGPINPLAVTVRHERIPPELRGRVFSTFSAIALAVAPLGVLTSGYLIERLGFFATLLVFALGAQLLGPAMLFVPALHDLDQTFQTDHSGRPA